MRITLLLQHLFFSPIRTAITLTGISIPIIPIFLQLGLLSAMMQTAGIFYDHLKFDLVVLSKQYLCFSKPGDFSESRIYQAKSVQGVEEVIPFKTGFHSWRNPETGSRREILVLGLEAKKDPPLVLPALKRLDLLLEKPDSVVIDRYSHSDFGPREIGTISELGSRKVETTGQYSMGAGFSALGTVIVSSETFDRIFGGVSEGRTTIGLISLTQKADSALVKKDLRRILPPDVVVMTRKELLDGERSYWLETTSLGVIIASGLIIAIAVGIVMIYQILSVDITNRISEFATLKAIGYSDNYLALYLLEYAIGLCAIGFLPGLTISWMLYHLIWKVTRLPMEISFERSALVFIITLAMALGAGLFTLRKIRRADPATLFV